MILKISEKQKQNLGGTWRTKFLAFYSQKESSISNARADSSLHTVWVLQAHDKIWPLISSLPFEGWEDYLSKTTVCSLGLLAGGSSQPLLKLDTHFYKALKETGSPLSLIPTKDPEDWLPPAATPGQVTSLRSGGLVEEKYTQPTAFQEQDLLIQKGSLQGGRGPWHTGFASPTIDRMCALWGERLALGFCCVIRGQNRATEAHRTGSVGICWRIEKKNGWMIEQTSRHSFQIRKAIHGAAPQLKKYYLPKNAFCLLCS